MEYLKIWLLLIWITSTCIFIYCNHGDPQKVYYTASYKRCRRWRRRCRTTYYVASKCAPGYSGSQCNQPLCRFGYGHNTCNVNGAGNVTLKNGENIKNSGGFCDSPSKCINCNTGYYSTTTSNGYCTVCHHPHMCNLNDCTDGSDKTCEYCVGEHKRDDPGYNVYTGKPDQTQCQRACSWVSGARCFPGSCTGDMVLAKNCECAKGFGGTNCATATEKKLPTITAMSLKIEGRNNHVYILDQAISTMNWTNIPEWSKLMLDVSSHYKLENVGDPPNYIMDFAIGIEEMSLTLTLSRVNDSGKWDIDGGCSGFNETCHYAVANAFSDITAWQNVFNKESGLFKHKDRIKFSMTIKNGGNVVYEDRDPPYSNKSYSLKGIEASQTLVLGFDFEQPDHCFVRSDNCTTEPLSAEDILKTPDVPVKWDGWTDLDSGIEKYTFNIYPLVKQSPGDPLRDGPMLPEVSFSSEYSSTTLQLQSPGPYSVELLVFDHAGNERAVRRIVMFDDKSVVDLFGNPPSIVQNNQYGWITKPIDEIEVKWAGRFHNTRHYNNEWLNAVETKDEIQRDLDDNDGVSTRTISSIDNINGIVRFDIAILTELNGNSALSDYKTISKEHFSQENMVYTEVDLVDGKRLTYIIHGVDIIGEYAVDNVTTRIDLSPPVINNLWLTKGDWVNISVHSVLDLSDLTIEWEAYDFHSGLHEVYWRIFDNFTKTDIVHGQSHEHPQGETNNITECEEKYGDYPRGHNCYCSPYNGCFHKHYQVKPPVIESDTGGLMFGKHIGKHDFDYYMEVTVTNNARLTTTVHKKITIDTSPPHGGTVHDGLPGEPEVDFQQSLELFGHWAGFFDKESSVWFYAYGFSDRCLNELDFDLQTLQNLENQGNWTYNTWAEFTATTVGKYYLTVIAFNHALAPNKPVCSDGVMIDAEPAVVSEIVVKDAVTASGLLKSNSSDTLYILNRNRELEEVRGPSLECSNRAIVVTETVLNSYPTKRHLNGSKNTKTLDSNCNNLSGVNTSFISFLTSATKVDISWNVTFGAGSVYDYEVGIASENSEIPDIMDFTSTHQHQHIRLFHPNLFDGKQFHILIKSITKTAVTDIKVVGPFVYDSSKPEFVGNIQLSVEQTNTGSFLMASWEENAFTDHGDSLALSYEAAIGSTKNRQNILPFNKLYTGGSCKALQPPVCTAFKIDSLPWHLHGGQEYYVTIKVMDSAGNHVAVSSEGYRHNVELASIGVVQDIDDPIYQFTDIQDVDYQTKTTTLQARWSGFEHPYETITYTVCVSNSTSEDFIVCELNVTSNDFTFKNIHLEPYQTYYQTVIAHTEAGNVTAISDGVTIIVDGDTIEGIEVYDGLPCNISLDLDDALATSHHDEDKRLPCTKDLEFQTSLNSLRANWIVPDVKKHYLKDIFWKIEERAPVADIWRSYTEYQHLKTTASYLEYSLLSLSPGITYRISIKFCAKQYCFKPVYSDGVTIIPNPPSAAAMSITYKPEEKKIEVSLDSFKDTDIVDAAQLQNFMDHYEWAFVDDSSLGRLLTKWQRVTPSVLQKPNKIDFTIKLNHEVTFTKCWILAVRGYTKAGLSSTVSSEIKPCQDIQQVRPSIVIDAVGDPLSTENSHLGKEIYMEKNAIWSKSDIDYSPYSNILSAVWPTLRQGRYTWAALRVTQGDVTIFYDTSNILRLPDPCSHPDAIKCGETANEFVNVNFSPDALEHGSRYMVCIHAINTTLHHEFWDEELDEISECSDGVTIDLTPPRTADVWIGNNKDFLYQTSTSELSVHWESFIDVEEEGYAVHTSGVSYYEVAIGTTSGGTDVKAFLNVGVTFHMTFHKITLQNGHIYFATVTAYDFTNQHSSSTSLGLKVDTTAPSLTERSISIPSRHISDKNYVEACWQGVFVDLESGISYYRWAIGTHPGYDDVFPFTSTEDECAHTPEDFLLQLQDGHAYFVTVQAHNNARLFASTSSWALTVVTSPPIAGKVFDGPIGSDGQSDDTDYIQLHSTVQAHWIGFHDPHSTILEYYINIGSCASCEDILAKQPVGLQTDIEFTHLQLSEGIHYYVTVTACNTANLCTSVTSDGFFVDSTPPIEGVVADGIVDIDIQYQASRNTIGCKWNRFTDPQSGISQYTWRVGTTKGGDNIIPSTAAHKHEKAFILDLEREYSIVLPKDVRLYCTVRAYNKAGKAVEASSNGFIIDDTPPIFATPLSMSPIGSFKNGTSILRNLLRVYWEVEDKESFIESQYLSISSHVGGDFNMSSSKVVGIARNYTFTDLDLHDGSYYDIKLVSCNGATLCSTSILKDILVDSTPPTQGTFAIDTDHAAALDRQRDNWMTWSRISMQLAWLGFEDAHSVIEEYSINIGNDFMGDDLNEIPGVPMKVYHDSNASYYEDGKVQVFKFQTQKLNENQQVYISVTATNGVGFPSPVLHSQFTLVYGRIMELVRRCSSYSCVGHCVCAPNEQYCHDQIQCNNVTGNAKFEIIDVKDRLDLSFPHDESGQSHSPVNTMLAAKWQVMEGTGARPHWYEWSVGESEYDSPLGIFDVVNEKVWQEVGKDMSCVFTVDRGRKVLEEHITYSVFVRAWYNSNAYAIFKSKGVTISHTPPLSISIRGKQVKEVALGSTKDIDFVTRNTQIFADWSGKFAGDILKYHVYISTHLGGHDVHKITKDLFPPVTRVNLTGLNYEENTKYYTIVQAFTNAGLYTTEVSDGFVLDMKSPTPGIVMDGLLLTDLHATNDSDVVKSFWHGFSDIGSGIHTYEYCISSGTVRGACDIKPLSPVGIATRIQINPQDVLQQGAFIRSEVRARDVVGHVSPLVSSNGMMIDTTPPMHAKRFKCNDNILTDSSFENVGGYDNFTTCDNMSTIPWYISSDTCVTFVNSSTAHAGGRLLHLRGAIFQTVNIETHGIYKLTFHTSTIHSEYLQLSAVDGYTEVNGEKRGFMIYTKPHSNEYEWQKHVYFFHIDTDKTSLKFGTAKNNVMFSIDDIQLQICEDSDADTEETAGNINTHTVFVHDWSSIHAEWSFIDPESGLIEYMWAIGTVPGGTQLQSFKSVGTRNFASNNTLHLQHGSVVHVTVIAVNGAGLRTVSFSDPIQIDLTPPECNYIYDGHIIGQDVDFIQGLKLDVHWDISDPESGILECYWAIGLFPGGSSVQEFVSVNHEYKNATKKFTGLPSGKVYVTLRCSNGAGLKMSCSSDGVKLIEAPPSVDGVLVELLTSSTTQYKPQKHYHGEKTEIRFRWTGFKYEEGVQTFEITLDGQGVSVSEIVDSLALGYSYGAFTGLDLVDGDYNVSVIGINSVKMYSQKRSSQFTLVTQPPLLTGKDMQTRWEKGSSFAEAIWDNVFSANEPLYYEVSARLDGGDGDIVQWQETTETMIRISFDSSEISQSGVKLRFAVRAVSYSGLFETAYSSLFIDL